MAMFHEGNRRLQDRLNGRRLSDRLVEHRMLTAFTDEYRAYVESVPFFFLATAHGEHVDCSFKGGHPGFVKVPTPTTLVFPDYDGNRMYKSLGNIAESPPVGLLFIKLDGRSIRLRVNGRATVHDRHPLLASYPGARMLVEIAVEHVFPNCPRYIPEMRLVAESPYIPAEGYEPPTPEWKTRDYIKDVL